MIINFTGDSARSRGKAFGKDSESASSERFSLSSRSTDNNRRSEGLGEGLAQPETTSAAKPDPKQRSFEFPEGETVDSWMTDLEDITEEQEEQEEEQVLNIGEILKKKGIQIDFIQYRDGDDEEKEPYTGVENPIEVARQIEAIKELGLIPNSINPDALKRCETLFDVFDLIGDILHEQNPDVVTQAEEVFGPDGFWDED